MKRKLSQARTRRERQIRNHGTVPVTLANFPGRVYWSKTVSDLHSETPGKWWLGPLAMFSGPTDPCTVCQRAIAAAQ